MKKALVTILGGLILFLGALAIVDWQIALIPVFQGLALALIPPLLYEIIAWGPRDFASAFVAIVRPGTERPALEKARSLFSSWGSATMIWSAAAGLVSLASMCRNLTDKSRLGYYLMISMTSLIYALIFSLVVCQSGKIIAERKLLDM